MAMSKQDQEITVGCWVTFRDPDIGEETVQVVDQEGLRPSLDKVPANSSFGQALLGAKAGQRVRFPLPNGGEDEVELTAFGHDE
jgi:transcription elongation GreA/GreB family factor